MNAVSDGKIRFAKFAIGKGVNEMATAKVYISTSRYFDEEILYTIEYRTEITDPVQVVEVSELLDRIVRMLVGGEATFQVEFDSDEQNSD